MLQSGSFCCISKLGNRRHVQSKLQPESIASVLGGLRQQVDRDTRVRRGNWGYYFSFLLRSAARKRYSEGVCAKFYGKTRTHAAHLEAFCFSGDSYTTSPLMPLATTLAQRERSYQVGSADIFIKFLSDFAEGPPLLPSSPSFLSFLPQGSNEKFRILRLKLRESNLIEFVS